MAATSVLIGFQTAFLGKGFSLTFPEPQNTADIVKQSNGETKLHYPHFSIVMSKSRRLAYYTAVNINGTKWKDNNRTGTWKLEQRILNTEQFGSGLYTAAKSNFDKGHLVKREDPEWGAQKESEEAGKSTFVFTNCTPQHSDLNKLIWQELENNILHTGAVGEAFKICVFTGPVLAANDPAFVTPVKGQTIKLPLLFWKVVVWKKSDGKLYAVGFIMSQESFLRKDGIIETPVPKGITRKVKDEDIFQHLQFKDGKTYQVSISEIEKLSGLTFGWSKVIKPFVAKTPKALSIAPGGKSLNKKLFHPKLKKTPKVFISGLTL